MNPLLQPHQLNEIKKNLPGGVVENADLSEMSRWKIGGSADCLIRPSGTEDVARLVSYLTAQDIPFIVIGSTSNLLFADEGLRIPCIQIGDKMCDFRESDDTLWGQSGIWMPFFARKAAQNGFSGIEHTAGIPGTLGGLICMNGGSQRKGIGSHIETVTAVAPDGEIKEFSREECGFAYRTSVFQENGYIITEALLRFTERRPYQEIRDEMLEILISRRKKFPQKLPNCGSTFISNPQIYVKYGPPGKVIEDLGYKGFRKGDAVVSEEHANFINNEGNAKAADVLWLIRKIRKDVENKTGFEMKAEVKFIDQFGVIKPAHLVDDHVIADS